MTSVSTPTPGAIGAAVVGRPRSVTLRDVRERLVMTGLVLCGLLTITITFAIIGVLAWETFKFFNYSEPVATSVAAEAEPARAAPADADAEAQADSGRITRDPILATITRNDDGRWVATLAPAVRNRIEFVGPGDGVVQLPDHARFVRPGDDLRTDFTGTGDARVHRTSLRIASVAKHELLLESGPAQPVTSAQPIELWHDPVTVTEFTTGGRWSPLLGREKHFGIWPLISGTMLITAVAMAFALPLGLVTAIWLAEYAPESLRGVIKPVLEVLAGIPTVVFGFFALTVITPGLQWFYSGFNVYNAMSAGIAVGIMTLPIVTSLSEDALRAVPRALREGAYGLGSTRFETSVRVVVPAALSGIIAAFLLAIARSVGETMIVALAAGASPPNLSENFAAGLDPTRETQPMTGYMVQIFLGDASHYGIENLSSYAVAATLFLMTLLLTLIGHRIRVRFRQVYD